MNSQEPEEQQHTNNKVYSPNPIKNKYQNLFNFIEVSPKTTLNEQQHIINDRYHNNIHTEHADNHKLQSFLSSNLLFETSDHSPNSFESDDYLSEINSPIKRIYNLKDGLDLEDSPYYDIFYDLPKRVPNPQIFDHHFELYDACAENNNTNQSSFISP